MIPTETRQLAQWRGDFGREYVARNQPTPDLLRRRVRAWSRILDAMGAAPPRRILEAGCNLGLNLRALRQLTDAELVGVEPNPDARARLVADGVVPPTHAIEGSLARLPLPDASVDLAFTCGVLIHVPPFALDEALDELHRVSARWIVAIEYFAVKPETVVYRGEDDLLFKRDFGSAWLDRFPDLEPVDCGFLWRRTTGWDDATWWLFRKP
ncbi:MAG: methyltransferase domain-containing protein [Gemmatimonadales bacterium]|nr:methyltransferase domain-containing protein [Gemmatimonadales bacterium]